MTKRVGSGSESGSGAISQRQGSADLDPDPHQNVMDPQHWFVRYSTFSQSHSLLFLREKNIEMAIFSEFEQPTLTALHHFKLHGARIMKTPAWSTM